MQKAGFLTTRLICKSHYWIPGLNAENYNNTPMQQTVNFDGFKKDNFLLKLFDLFLSFAQNIDCGYMVELPH